MLEHRAPARRVSESTVSENDSRLGHQASFSLGGVRSQPPLIVPSSHPWFALVRCPCKYQGLPRTRCPCQKRTVSSNAVSTTGGAMVLLRFKIHSKPDKSDEL